MAAAALDEGGKRAAVAVGEFLNKVKTFALDIKAKVTLVTSLRLSVSSSVAISCK